MAGGAFNILSLCSGVGGLELGLKRIVREARVVCWVEWDIYRAEVLAERMEEARLDTAPVWSDLHSFDGRAWSGVVDCVVAGYPCQPFSVAGRRSGEDHPEHLWPQCFRVIRESGAEWVILENVPGHLSLGFDKVAGDLQGLGFRVAAGLFSAFEAGGTHKRLRLYAVGRRTVGDPNTPRLEGRVQPIGEGPDEIAARPPSPQERDRWRAVLEEAPQLSPVVPVVRGMADGVPAWVDRVKTLGEAACPDTTEMALRQLMPQLL